MSWIQIKEWWICVSLIHTAVQASSFIQSWVSHEYWHHMSSWTVIRTFGFTSLPGDLRYSMRSLVVTASLKENPSIVDCVWNVMAHAQKPDFVYRRNGWVHLNRRGRQLSRLLAAESSASAVVMLDTPRSEAVCNVLATHSIRQFSLHFPSGASPCVITFQLDPTYIARLVFKSKLFSFTSYWALRLRGMGPQNA